MPQLGASIRCQEDGVALEKCRVLRKNSNMPAVASISDTAFLSTRLPNQVQFSSQQNVTARVIIKAAQAMPKRKSRVKPT
jgi:hypothetical protein